VGDHVLDPAFTDYQRTVLYEIYDAKEFLREGQNALGVMLGNGWYNMASRGVWSFDRAPWRNDPALRLMLRITYQDGSVLNVDTDSTWKCSPGPIIFNSIRQGEFYDARLEQSGWASPEFDDNDWFPVRQVTGAMGRFRSQTMQPIRIINKLIPENIIRTTANTWVCDFGQNIAGFAEISLNATRGKRIELKYGEKLQTDGTVDQQNIKGLVAQDPFQTDQYITKGEEVETWHPRFVYHGFRYIEVSGFPGLLTEENIRACVVHTDVDKKGDFKCSSDLLNQIQQNTEWSFVNNYHGYPTDCPHREKNGWTGDAQLASEMALFNYHVESAYDKWINDIVDAQLESGMIPSIVPTGGWGYHWGNGPAWDFALFILPWNMYLYSDDRQVLRKYFPAIKKYLNFLSGTTEDLVIRWGLGDWVPAKTITPPELITTAYFYKQALLAGKMAEILGYEEDKLHFLHLAEKVRESFQSNFVLNETPWVGNGSQTSLGCALYFALLDSADAVMTLQKLIKNISEDDMNLDFGVLGSKFVPNALAENENIEVAYNMINTTEYPGWGNWVDRGATTLWEDWNGQSSLNHVFFGDVSAWFYKYLAGIQPDESQPGFKHFFISPYFPDDLEWVKAHVNTYYGKIESNWKKEQQKILLSIRIPFNSSATVRLKKVKIISLREEVTNSVLTPEIIRSENQLQEILLGAGEYLITLEN
jgi:alpha-L-rhamnosidase